MSADALELEIERAWVALCSSRRKRTVMLTRCNSVILAQPNTNYGPLAEEVGTYTTDVALQDFREDVFHVHDNRGRKHG